MTTITLTTELEQAIGQEAEKRGVTTAEVALETLQKTFLPDAPFSLTQDTLSEWELGIRTAASQISAVSDNEQAGLAAIEKELRRQSTDA